MPALEDDLFLMANLSPRLTGLPFIVWISPRAGARHDVRVKISRHPRVRSSELIHVALRPTLRVVSKHGSLSADELALLSRWVELNRETILGYWNGDIEYTEEAIARLKPI
jgi:hypothetical protein